MNTHVLDVSDIPVVDSLVLGAMALQQVVDQDSFNEEISILSHQLPEGLIRVLTEFRLKRAGSPVVVISGLPVCDEDIGPTPSHWNNSKGKPTKTKEEIFLMLCGAILGDPICWATQQGGKLVHDILPIKGQELLQTGASSDIKLEWHTEEAFHELRPDYIGLLCLRNPDGTATTVGTFDPSWMSEEDIEHLFQPYFQIRPDDSHLMTTDAQGLSDQLDQAQLIKSCDAMARRDTAPKRVSVLSGAREDPFICIDPAFMHESGDSAQYSGSLERAIDTIDAHMEDLVLQPGDVAFIDNAKAVHGRKPFTSRHDGADRWLKRISLTRDLSKSSHARIGNSNPIIY